MKLTPNRNGNFNQNKKKITSLSINIMSIVDVDVLSLFQILTTLTTIFHVSRESFMSLIELSLQAILSYDVVIWTTHKENTLVIKSK